MNYKVRKGPEFSPSDQIYSLQEIEQGLHSGAINRTWQVRKEGHTAWLSVADISSVTADPAESSTNGFHK